MLVECSEQNPRERKMLQVKTGTFLIHLPLQNLSSEPSIPLQDLIKRNHAVQSSFQTRSYLRPSLPSDPCHVLLPLLASCNDVTFQDQVFPAKHLYITHKAQVTVKALVITARHCLLEQSQNPALLQAGYLLLEHAHFQM